MTIDVLARPVPPTPPVPAPRRAPVPGPGPMPRRAPRPRRAPETRGAGRGGAGPGAPDEPGDGQRGSAAAVPGGSVCPQAVSGREVSGGAASGGSVCPQAVSGTTTSPGPGLDGLLTAARGGDADSWRLLHRRLNPLVLATARRQGLRPAECEDVAQVTWLRLFENVDRIRDDLALPGWLTTTARREARTTLLRRAREVVADPRGLESYPATTCGPEETVETRRLLDRMVHAIGRLPDRERLLLHAMLDPAEPSYRQLGQALGMPVGAIGPTRQRAIHKLREMLHVLDGDRVGR